MLNETEEIIVTGKTVDEAYAEATAQLGEDATDVHYEVLEWPKKGLLGIGATPAKVRVSYTKLAEEPVIKFLKMVIADLGLDAQPVLKDSDEETLKIEIEGSGASALIGHHGDTLDALQYLANLSANKAADAANVRKITLDIENYRAKREQTLCALARRMAARAIKYRRNVVLEPMNPYERRIIHAEVQKMEGVSTHSVGSENDRKVVIVPDNAIPRGERDEQGEGAKKSGRGRSRGGRNRDGKRESRPAEAVKPEKIITYDGEHAGSQQIRVKAASFAESEYGRAADAAMSAEENADE